MTRMLRRTRAAALALLTAVSACCRGMGIAPAARPEWVVVDNSGPGFRSRARAAVPILLYHGLDSHHGMDPRNFVVQMDFLAAGEFRTMTLDALTSWVVTGLPAPPPRAIVLTFDDNYESVWSVAFPALAARGFTGVNYAHTRFVGVNSGLDHCDWDEIRRMESAGVVFTESHGVNHRRLGQMRPASVDAELAGSRDALRANIPGKIAVHIAYPYGSHNDDVVSRTAAAGFASATTTAGEPVTRSTSPWRMGRFEVNPRMAPDAFRDRVLGADGAAGEWTRANWAGGCLGTDFVTAPAGDGGAVAWWSFTAPTTGTLTVETRWPRGRFAPNAPYTVFSEGGIAVVRLDQTGPAGQWKPLGQHAFLGGRRYWVALSNQADGVVAADAIRVGATGPGAGR